MYLHQADLGESWRTEKSRDGEGWVTVNTRVAIASGRGRFGNADFEDGGR